MGGNWGKKKKVTVKKEKLSDLTNVIKELRSALHQSEENRILSIIQERERCAGIARDFDTVGDPINWPSRIAEEILKHGNEDQS